MKFKQVLIIILSFMSCNKFSNKVTDITTDTISLNSVEDSIIIDSTKQQDSKLTLKVEIVEDEGGSKYNWVRVNVLSIIKNDTLYPISNSLSIAYYSWLPGLQEGKTYIVYLVPFPIGSEEPMNLDQWILLKGNGSIGAELIKKTNKNK
jgi:hypothetical protein